MDETTPDEFEQMLWSMIGLIPEGSVATYGQLASLCGRPRHARQVGKVLSKLPKDSVLPWHRVINAKGESSFPVGSDRFLEQQKRLQEEGVAMIKGKIKLANYQAHLG
jgi:methylated-DNA-protein-cysteine methyltransferase-like protein